MDVSINAQRFRELFDGRAIVVADVPAGAARDVAAKANRPAGPADATLRTRQEFDALFDGILLEARPDQGAAADPPILRLTDEHGAQTAAGRLVDSYRAASIGKEEFFGRSMYMAAISDWPAADMRPEEPVAATGDARIALWRASPVDQRAVPPPDDSGVLFTSSSFALVNSGNRTKDAPKRSWKVDVEPGDDGASRGVRRAAAVRLGRLAGIPSAREQQGHRGTGVRPPRRHDVPARAV
jgi:hypothetical protein